MIKKLYKDTKKLFILSSIILGIFMASFYTAEKVKAVPCGTDPACLEAAASCEEDNGVFNSETRTCNPRTTSTNVDGQIDVEGSGDEIFDLIQNVINILFGMSAFVVIGMIIVAGIQYSTAGGSPQATTDAKKKISNAILALVLLAFLYPFLKWLVLGGSIE
jgi:uncharacterized membrane protein YraQ (UPF0718 family)